ncbi:hypothetical protein ElyMa_006887000 [Elysia marginata]|uniref:Uncharacterized protein n=1 Tax=Elysia marginata TaxID=1093978 RepID=A0AAV4JDU7_9GAST|nr:hypothetical protein ElyMa_006887000 [Elysia marginata]
MRYGAHKVAPSLIVVLVICSIYGVDCKILGARKELRIAWLAPSQTVMGVSASTSVNTFKYALRAIETSYLKGHYTKESSVSGLKHMNSIEAYRTNRGKDGPAASCPELAAVAIART